MFYYIINLRSTYLNIHLISPENFCFFVSRDLEHKSFRFQRREAVPPFQDHSPLSFPRLYFGGTSISLRPPVHVEA